jgi:hypothetical protein
MQFQYSQNGGATYTVNVMGNGDEARTAIAAGAQTEYPFSAVSYFNGYAKINNLSLVGMTDFSMSFENNLTRIDTAFNNGIASGIVAGLMDATGSLGLIMGVAAGADPEDTMNFYDMAVNQTDIPIEVLYANGPVATATQWCRIRAYVRFSRKSWKPGGAAGIMITQDFQLIPTLSADWSAEIFNDKVGGSTFALVLDVNDQLGIKVDGGATQVVTFTAGAAVTAAALIAEINTQTTGCTADVWNGRIRIKSDTTGSTSSLEIDSTTAETCHTTLGFLADTEITGYTDTPFVIEVYNDNDLNYSAFNA